MSNGKVKKWRKVLYDNAGFPDNFTPEEAFLAARRYNENLVTYSLQSCLSGGAEVATQLSLVIIFWSFYKFIKSGSLSPASLTLCVTSVSVRVSLHHTQEVTEQTGEPYGWPQDLVAVHHYWLLSLPCSPHPDRLHLH